MKKIIVATDFSKTATNAVYYATDMAMAINATLVLMNAFEIPALYTEAPLIENIQVLKQDAQDALDRLKEQVKERCQNKLVIETWVEEGGFFMQLKAACESIKPYAVVMGSQGTTAAERFFFGGHAVHAMKHLQWPLITVPDGASFSAIKKIGLALDFDKINETTPIEEIKQLVTDFGAKLHVLNSGNATTYSADTVHGSAVLRDLLGNIQPHFHFITSNDLDKGIMEFAEQHQIDLLIILPKRHSLIEKIVYQSHTKKVVLHSHIPVMALHHQ